MTSYYDAFIKNVEKKTGLAIKEINKKDPNEMREYFENKFHSKMSFPSEFPYIGRGNVLHDGIMSHEQIDSEIDKLLKVF